MLLGSAHGKVTIDASGVRTGTKQAVSDLTRLAAVGNQVGDALKNVGRSMTIGLTLPIIAVGGAAIKAASDFEETKNKVKVVFGEMSDDMLSWGNNAINAFGLSRAHALEAAGTFGNLFTSMGMGVEASAEMSKGLVELAQDLHSFNNIPTAQVLEKLRSGLVGEVEPLRTLGINLSMTAVKAKAVAMGLADANGEVSQAALLQARYALILEQTKNAQGDYARTADSMANSSERLKEQLNESLIMLGENLLPIALKVVTALNGLLEKFNGMSPAMQKATIGFGVFLAMLGPGISMLGTVVSLLSTLAGLAGGGGLAGLGISLGGIGTAASAAGAGISGALVPALMAIGPVILALLPAVGLLYFAFKYNFGGIRTTAEQLWWLLKYGFSRAVESIKVTLGQLGFIIQWAFQNAFQNLGAMLTNGLRQIPEIIARIRERIVAFFRQDWSVFGKLIIFGIVNGILGGIPWLAQAVKYIAATILNGLKKALGIRSPSTEGEYFGRMVARGMVMGLEEERAALAQAARDSAQAVTAQLQGAGSTFFKGGAGAPQFKPATAGNMQAAFKQFLANSGATGKGQFSAPTSSNMQAAFKQFAATQAAVKAGPDRFTEKDRKYKTEVPIVMNFEKGITTKEAHDIYSEKLGNVLGFLEKRLAN